MTFAILFKTGKHSDFQLSFFQIMGLWQDFTAVTRRIKILRVYMVLGETFVWIFNHVSRSITSFLCILKASNLVKPHGTNLMAIFHVVVSDYRSLEI